MKRSKDSSISSSETLMKKQRSRLAVTMGDPAGIGPEVVLKALADPTVTEGCEITVIGSRSLLEDTYRRLQHLGSEIADPDSIGILDLPLDALIEGEIVTGEGNAASGAASFAYLETAIARTLGRQFQGIVTAPIAKSMWKAAGRNYPGQTEVLAYRSGVRKYGMLFIARSPHNNFELRTLLATTHIPLRQVAETLTPELLTAKLDLLVECLQTECGIKSPRIAIAGLNPHSGEQGQLGYEEKDWLIPWLEQERQKRPQVQLEGPQPPDTMWVRVAQAWYGSEPPKGVYDAYLALYHDQGLIPVKMVAFDRAVNTTIGLPFVRTSPDHGTAFDIAGRGIADPTSMKAAIQLATQLTNQKIVSDLKSA